MIDKSDVDLTLLRPAVEKFIHLGRSGLLPSLQAIQRIYGWIPREAVISLVEILNISFADVYGVLEFYGLLNKEPRGAKTFRVCTDLACSLKGSDEIYHRLLTSEQVDSGIGKPILTNRVDQSTCLGLCDHSPAMLVNDDVVPDIASDKEEYTQAFPMSKIYGDVRWLTNNCGNRKSTTIEDYGEYRSLQLAKNMLQESVIEQIKASGLVGRGGAAFPTGVKWEGASKAAGTDKYVVCNADESEPGTFKDRVLLGDDPHKIIEGMCIAAYAIGAKRGFIYLRGEYAYLLNILDGALNEARQLGYLNDDFDIEIRLGAGAYICGEETALFESIEGKRGFPRVKPPFPTTQGLFGVPTVINNVETLANVPIIFEKGVNEYRSMGTMKSPGTKLFCISGDVLKPGVYEIPFGIPIRELLEMAGMTSTAQDSIQAILMGGAAGAFTTPEKFDTRLSFEDLRTVNLPLGSGVIMVFNKSRDLRESIRKLADFFAHESCGKCFPCQLGTQRQKEILNRIANGKILDEDIDRLQDVGWTMSDASLCGLGQTAATAVLSAINNFPQLFK